jgi:hypothetical protein
MSPFPIVMTALALSAAAAGADTVTAVKEPSSGTPLYTANRAPLVPSKLIKLPIGAIKPGGWLAGMLAGECDGMTGHLNEISPWCKFENNAWSDPQGAGKNGWEELPYWLKGFGDLGYVTGDPRVLAEAKRWIDAILVNQDADGFIGPRGLKTALDGKADLWPAMPILNALQSWYEHSGDERVLPYLTRYFRWEMDYPAEKMVAGYWPNVRIGDNIESVLWLYNRTGEPFLLDLAAKLHRRGARWDGGVINWHGVNVSQGFREPAMFWLASGDPAHLAAAYKNYDKVMALYGQMPGGGFAADENARPGYHDPRQRFETCSIVEFMHSFELLARFTADTKWADRCEELAFNTLPAALTPDQRALHYLTCANQVQLDRGNKSPGIQNGGCMFAYSPGAVYRCCQHNVSMGWPYFAEELWYATADRGLLAMLHAASSVTAKVGADGAKVDLTASGDYPFSDTITYKLLTAAPVRFPLYLRVPQWSGAPMLTINGAAVAVSAEPGWYLKIDRQWADGDTVTVQFPMSIKIRTWNANHDAVSVDRGPLTYSLKIDEDWRTIKTADLYPDYEVYPKSAWNYGLVLDGGDPAKSFTLAAKPGPLATQPFKPDAVPLSLTAAARRIPGWQVDHNNLLTTLQASPVRSEEPQETVTLIPMGAARLRLAALPVIGAGPEAHEWAAPGPAAVSASHCFENDSVDAMINGSQPKSSKDTDIPRMTWWDHRGSTEWVQWNFPKARTISATQVYWFDDTGIGACRVPQSWRVLVKVGDAWQPVEDQSPAGVEPDKYNKVTFKPVETTAMRLEVVLQPGWSGGILQWQVQ